MNRNALIAFATIVGIPVLALLFFVVGSGFGLGEKTTLKLVFSALPIGLGALVLGSYLCGECLYGYSRGGRIGLSPAKVRYTYSISAKKSPVLFHFLQLILMGVVFLMFAGLVYSDRWMDDFFQKDPTSLSPRERALQASERGIR